MMARRHTNLSPDEGAICTVCGDPATIRSRFEDMCRFHWDCLNHELQIRLDTIRDFGPHGRDNGPTYGLTFFGPCNEDKAGMTTIGMGLYVSRTPQEAMVEALRMAVRNNMRLLRLDTQNTVPSWPGRWRQGYSCVDLYRDRLYSKYMAYSDKGPLTFDERTFGPIPVALLQFNDAVHR